MYVRLIFCFLIQISFSSSQNFSDKNEVQAQRKWIDSVLDGIGVHRAKRALKGISEQSVKSTLLHTLPSSHLSKVQEYTQGNIHSQFCS